MRDASQWWKAVSADPVIRWRYPDAFWSAKVSWPRCAANVRRLVNFSYSTIFSCTATLLSAKRNTTNSTSFRWKRYNCKDSKIMVVSFAASPFCLLLHHNKSNNKCCRVPKWLADSHHHQIVCCVRGHQYRETGMDGAHQ